MQGGERALPTKEKRNKSIAGGECRVFWGTRGNMHKWNLCLGGAMGGGPGKDRNNYKIPLEVFYRIRVFLFPPGKLHSLPYTPAEVRT